MTATNRIRRVLYVVSRFPSLRTTFTANEMAALNDLGVTIHVAATWRSLDRDHPHAVERPFLPRLQVLALTRPAVWLRAGQQVLTHPGVLVLLVRLLFAHLASLPALLKLGASIPKGLYLGWWARQNQIDHIHAHFLTTPTTVALIASAASGIPFTATGHAFDIFETRPHLRNRAIRLKCAAAAFVVMISDFNARFMQQNWPGIPARLETLYNGIDLDQFTPCPHPPQTPTRILSVGQLTPKKGHADLIRAVAQLIAQGRAVELSIIGEGPLQAELAALCAELGITEQVHLLGRQSQTEVRAAYCTSDIFALASVIAPGGDRDGIPTVLLEALAVELPAVSTRLSGIPEVLIDGETGICVASGNVDALANALAQLIDDPAHAAAMAQRGRARVVQHFDRRQNAARLLQLWNDLHGNI